MFFADPIGDIAVLGPPDDHTFYEEAEAYEALTASVRPLAVAHAPNKGIGWIPSLDGQWFQCDVRHRNGPLWIVRAAKEIKGRMAFAGTSLLNTMDIRPRLPQQRQSMGASEKSP
jgi:hypothetical protein